MKLITVLNKNFPSVEDYMEFNEDDDRVLYFMVTKDEEQCEPDYSISQYVCGNYIIRDIKDTVLIKTTDEKEVKNFLKVLAK